MIGIDYPYDSETLLRERRRLKRELLGQSSFSVKKRIAVLGGSTTKDIIDMLELFLLNEGINPVFYESEYNQYEQDALFPPEGLVAFSPEIVIINVGRRNIKQFPIFSMSKGEINQLLESETTRYLRIWESLQNRFNCVVIQNNFDFPSYRLLGNKDASDTHGTLNFLMRLNLRLAEEAEKFIDVLIHDQNYLAASYGLKRWNDDRSWNLYKYGFSIKAVPTYSHSLSRMILALCGKSKKAIVVDLDNTLWGGVISEDGLEGLEIGKETAVGESYTSFQNYLVNMKNRGIMLAVNSKNDHDMARLGLSHPKNLLSEQDFTVIKANWENKDNNFAAIADEIGILPESMVFIDDNPAERLIIKTKFPNAGVVDVNDVDEFIDYIEGTGWFETVALSDSDLKRSEMYIQNQKRESFRDAFQTYEDYLQNLQMEATIDTFQDIHIARIAQLTNKSNQYNLTTRRFSGQELVALMHDENYFTLCCNLMDKFGDNGIVSLIIAKTEGSDAIVLLWLMSCRVLKRNVEFAMMDELVATCLNRRITRLIGRYIPSGKNDMVKDHFDRMGFHLVRQDNCEKHYIFEVNDKYEKQNKTIKIINSVK